ncbi:MAG: hypothetical protein HC812_01350 [Leptolyngbya sp. RL_3_1]|nr:hypothetical protein [Leptolyngbya sp. RL_3_1]
MKSFYPYLAGITGTVAGLSLIAASIVPTTTAADPIALQLSVADLHQAEYRLEVPGRGSIVASPLSWAVFRVAASTSNWDAVAGEVVLIEATEDAFDLPIVHRDLNGDQFEEALVPLWAVPQRVNSAEDYTMALATVLNEGGNPVHVATEWFGRLYEVTERDDQIIVYVEGSPEDDYQEQVLTYTWSTSGLEQVSQAPFSLEVPFPEGRDRYWVSDLDRWESVHSTAEPLAALQAMFSGGEEPRRGTDWVVLTKTEDQLVVGHTRRGLRDDSVSAIRYRFEFVVDGAQWRLDWVGQQFSCVWGRGRQSWHNQLCS